MKEIAKIAATLSADYEFVDASILLDLAAYRLVVRSNCNEMLSRLATYFSGTLAKVSTEINSDDIIATEILVIEREAVELELNYIDWHREAGKSGRKDSYVDVEGGRIVRKVRTGMIFIQSQTCLVVAGPCVTNDNQVINFINAQYMTYLQQHGALICHASALSYNEKCLAIAGLSGGGKSTLMLQILQENPISYITNDRLFLKQNNGRITANGVPKLPRVNPGTVLNNDQLSAIISKQRKDELNSLPLSELWDLEEKYDVFIEACYGSKKVESHAILKAVLILNWQRDSREQTKIYKVNIQNRQDLLPALMKSPGPFYQYQNGSLYQDDTTLDEQDYLAHLKGISVYEVTGKIDFDFAKQYCLEQIIG